MEKDSLATEMMKELKINAKRWFIISIVELIIILTVGILFIWYLNTPTEEDEVITTEYMQDANTEGDNSPINQEIGE